MLIPARVKRIRSTRLLLSAATLSTYFKNISDGISTTVTGMRLTLRHLWQARKRRKITDIRSDNFYDLQDGMVTIQYPQETVAIPDNGRYRLHNEMDDCIVCDKCVKVCPVDCIEIEPIKAIEEVGRASDGSPIRLYAAKFDIDMAKCCYCGLCTTVCPTECLTMTKTFDYSELDVRDMVYNYANLTAEQADEKRALLEQFQKEKEALKAAAPKPVTASEPTPATARPAFKPTIKPKVQDVEAETGAEPATKRPVFLPKKPLTTEPATPDTLNEEEVIPVSPRLPFRPSMKPGTPKAEEELENKQTAEDKPVSKAPFRPTMKPKAETAAEPTAAPESSESVAPKPAFRPTMKPKAEASAEPTAAPESSEPVAPKPAFRPTMKPKAEASAEPTAAPEGTESVAPKTAFRPTMKPKAEASAEPTAAPESSEPVAPKPEFRPTMKPKAEASAEPTAAPESTKPVAPKPAFRPTMKPKAETSAELSETPENIEPVAPKPAFRPTMKPKPKADE